MGMPRYGKAANRAKKKRPTRRVRSLPNPKKSGVGPQTDTLPWPYVEVHWHDATSDSEWRAHDEVLDVSLVITRGWMIKKNSKCVVIAATLCTVGDHEDAPVKDDEKPSVGELITIPIGCIPSGGITEIEVKAKSRKKETRH